MKQTLVLLVIILLGVLCQSPAQAPLLHDECPSDLGYAGTCSPSISFSVFDNSLSMTFSPLSVTPVSVYDNDYLIAITNSSSTPVYGVILSTSPYVTADTRPIGSPCAGSSDGYSATAQICDPFAQATFPGGLLPGHTHGVPLELLPLRANS